MVIRLSLARGCGGGRVKIDNLIGLPVEDVFLLEKNVGRSAYAVAY